MPQLDETIFDETGLGELTAEEKQRILAYTAKTLEARVGIRLTSEANSEQLKEFDKLADAGDDDKIMEWLPTAFPNFGHVVEEELARIKSELKDMAKDILAARE